MGWKQTYKSCIEMFGHVKLVYDVHQQYVSNVNHACMNLLEMT